MKINVSKFSPEGKDDKEKLQHMEDYLSQFTNNIIDILTSRANFADQFDCQVKDLEINGSGDYVVITNRSSAIGGLILRSSNNSTLVESFNFYIEGQTVKLRLNLNEEKRVIVKVVVFFS